MATTLSVKPDRATNRRHIVTTLAQEILSTGSDTPYRIGSEHQLCRRFEVSRVTLRLALGDLENRGLIFRRHGVGTFAYGRSNQTSKHLGILIKSPIEIESGPLVELLRGAKSVTAPLKSSLVLIEQSPEEWTAQLASLLMGVLVLPPNVSLKELNHLTIRKIPFCVIGQTDLPVPAIEVSKKNVNHFEAGQRAVTALLHAFATGQAVSQLHQAGEVPIPKLDPVVQAKHVLDLRIPTPIRLS